MINRGIPRDVAEWYYFAECSFLLHRILTAAHIPRLRRRLFLLGDLLGVFSFVFLFVIFKNGLIFDIYDSLDPIRCRQMLRWTRTLTTSYHAGDAFIECHVSVNISWISLISKRPLLTFILDIVTIMKIHHHIIPINTIVIVDSTWLARVSSPILVTPFWHESPLGVLEHSSPVSFAKPLIRLGSHCTLCLCAQKYS